MSLKVRCANNANGCQWEQEFRNLEEHTRATCNYVQITCPSECTQNGVNNAPLHITVLLKKDLEENLNNDCLKRSVLCPNCGQRGEFWDIRTVHPANCVEAKLHCTNELCKKEFPRRELAGHLRVCKFQLIPCKYAEIGCTTKDVLKEIEKHESDRKIHFPLLLRSFVALKNDYAVLKEEVRILNAPDRFVFKFPSFEQHKNEELIFKSGPFFTHKQGYKMVVGITPHGYSCAKGTHLSVHLYLVQGPFDNQLTWPFSGTLHIELLNQLDNNQHHRKTINVEGITIATGEDEQHMVGWGIPYFILHKQMGYCPNKKCQYLKDDCVVFRVVAHVAEHKTWLQCTTTFI